MVLNYEENENVILDNNTSNINSIETENEKSSLEYQFDELLKSLSNIKPQITSIQNQIKNVERNVNKEIKCLKKIIEKKKNKAKREPSGFAKPCKVSDNLCLFMNQPIGTLISRPDATKYLISYIMKNNLYMSHDRRYILCDETLKELLGENVDDCVSFFSLQGYMNKHFLK
jgi:chromatin remodeling complex protein RSC6